ncbi:MAG: helix-turn-helix transcriptional regulator [Proteobacteria bacterium]|nr:helix-turn-helix transcriptional regulator [Pseudomonadota bacterium]
MKQVITSPEALGHFIKRSRKAKKITQYDAGMNFNVDQTTISSIEQGAHGTGLVPYLDY